jgi:hypothetical protein
VTGASGDDLIARWPLDADSPEPVKFEPNPPGRPHPSDEESRTSSSP